jgi:peroxiredoxin
LQKRNQEFRNAGVEILGIAPDSGERARVVPQQTGASYPLLSDPDLKVTLQFDMQLRAGWPMGGMGRFPEMGFVIVDGKGIIRAQRVDLYFGQTAIQMLPQLRSMQ